MLVLGVPVIDQQELTFQFLDSLAKTVHSPESFHLVLIDNDSEKSYDGRKLRRYRDAFAQVTVLHNEVNRGYYWPLLQVTDLATPADLVALAHNDMVIYEQGWDDRLRAEFVKDGDLGLVGFCGSGEVDDRGGRGGDTKCFFRGELGQDQSCGRRIYDLEPACLLDSLFMCFRAVCVPLLDVDGHIPLCHFVDKVWPLRLIDKGWRVGVLGVELDHMGGMTAVANPRFETDCAAWCIAEGIEPEPTAGQALYFESERRFLEEFRDKGMIPGRMHMWKFQPDR